LFLQNFQLAVVWRNETVQNTLQLLHDFKSAILTKAKI